MIAIKKDTLLKSIYIFLIFYLLINTPYISDDFFWMTRTKNSPISSLLIPSGWFLIAPLEHYLLFIWTRFFEIDNLIIVSLFKILYVSLSFFLVAKFFTIFLSKQKALLASFLFIFLPCHDATVFSYVGLYSTLTIVFYLYAFYLLSKNKLTQAFLIAAAASFTSYASIPMALPFFIFFALNKEIKKAWIIFIPNVIFSLHYILITKVMKLTGSQIPDTLNIANIMKYMVLQFLTSIDSTLGPSMWLKIYYSFFNLKTASLAIGILSVIFFYNITDKDSGTKEPYNKKLLILLMSISLYSMFIFGLTGWYPQMAFGLGNRTTIYSSLLISYLIVLLPVTKKMTTLLFAVLVFTVLGVSDHWKSFSIYQQDVIRNIKNNNSLKTYSSQEDIFVSKSQYSRYGPFSHIEFLSEDWAPSSLFNLALHKTNFSRALNKRHKYLNGYLIDTKYNQKIPVGDYINIYDSEKNVLFKLKAKEINNYINFLPQDTRHWVQLLNNDGIRNVLCKLMPRLNYIFNRN